MNTDRSVGPLVVQFVPLKVNVKTDSYQQWAKRYSHDGRGIPIVYIVRGDGEKLYGKSGSLRGAELGELLVASLLDAGRVLDLREAEMLEETVEQATQALADDDPLTAVKALLATKRIGPLGELGSYAKSAVAADELVKQLIEQARETIASAQTILDGEDATMQPVLDLVAAQRVYGKLPPLRQDFADIQRHYARRAAFKERFVQARSLDRALALAQSPKGQKSALRTLQQLAVRHAGQEAGERAAAEIEKLTGEKFNPETKIDPQTGSDSKRTDAETVADSRGKVRKPSNEVRRWTDKTGKHHVRARLLGIKNEVVYLRQDDGKRVKLPLKKLSAEDQQYVQQLAKP